MVCRYKKVISLALIIFTTGCAEFTPLYVRSNNYDRAMIHYNNGRVLAARKLAGLVHKKDSKYKASQKLIRDINKLARRLANRHIELGREYERAGIHSMAKAEYRAAKRLLHGQKKIQKKKSSPTRFKKKRRPQKTKKPVNLAESHYESGKNFLEGGDYPAAIEEFNLTLSCDPDYKDTTYLIEEILEERDSAVSLHMKKGIAFFQKDELEKAIEQWDIVLRLDPENSDAKGYKIKAETMVEKLKKIRGD